MPWAKPFPQHYPFAAEMSLASVGGAIKSNQIARASAKRKTATRKRRCGNFGCVAFPLQNWVAVSWDVCFAWGKCRGNWRQKLLGVCLCAFVLFDVISKYFATGTGTGTRFVALVVAVCTAAMGPHLVVATTAACSWLLQHLHWQFAWKSTCATILHVPAIRSTHTTQTPTDPLPATSLCFWPKPNFRHFHHDLNTLLLRWAYSRGNQDGILL